MRIMEQLGFFTALGVVIVFIAAVPWAGSPRWRQYPGDRGDPETTVPADTVPVETVRSEETRPVHTRLLPRRKTEDTRRPSGKLPRRVSLCPDRLPLSSARYIRASR